VKFARWLSEIAAFEATLSLSTSGIFALFIMSWAMNIIPAKIPTDTTTVKIIVSLNASTSIPS